MPSGTRYPRGAAQPVRRGPLDVARPLDLDFFTRLHRMDFASRFSRPTTSTRGHHPLARFLCASVDFARWRERRSSCSSPPPTSIPPRRVFRNAEVTPDVMLASPPAHLFQRWRSTASPIGTAATRATPPDPRCANAGRATPSWCRSTRRAPGTPRSRARSSTASTRSRSTGGDQGAADDPLLRRRRSRSGEVAAWAGMRIHRVATTRSPGSARPPTHADGLLRCCATRRAAAEAFLAEHGQIWANARRSTSTSCSGG